MKILDDFNLIKNKIFEIVLIFYELTFIDKTLRNIIYRNYLLNLSNF